MQGVKTKSFTDDYQLKEVSSCISIIGWLPRFWQPPNHSLTIAKILIDSHKWRFRSFQQFPHILYIQKECVVLLDLYPLYVSIFVSASLLWFQELGTGMFSVCHRCVHKASSREFAVKVTALVSLFIFDFL